MAALASEARFPAEVAAVAASGWSLGRGFPRGHGRPIVLVPGFFTPEAGMAPLRGALRRAGWWVRVARTGLNVDCSEQGVQRTLEAVDHVLRRRPGPVAVVGHSRGGHLAMAAAARRPDDVRLVVTLGTPSFLGPPPTRVVMAMARGVSALERAGLPGLASMRCATDPCCERFRADLRGPRPDGVRHVCVLGTNDGVVQPEGGRWPGADEVLVPATHLGLTCSPPAWRAIADALRAAA
jgi:pimeloyl-ACP methyl ester carboxylesterase